MPLYVGSVLGRKLEQREISVLWVELHFKGGLKLGLKHIHLTLVLGRVLLGSKWCHTGFMVSSLLWWCSCILVYLDTILSYFITAVVFNSLCVFQLFLSKCSTKTVSVERVSSFSFTMNSSISLFYLLPLLNSAASRKLDNSWHSLLPLHLLVFLVFWFFFLLWASL